MKCISKIVTMFAFFVIASSASAGALNFDLQFDEPSFQSESKGFSSITISGLPNTIDAGMPSVPFKTMKIALPSGGVFEGVGIRIGEIREYDATPVRSSSQLPFSFRQGVPKSLKAAPAPSYKGEQYPKNRFSYKLQKYHGVPVVIVNVYPVVSRRSGSVEYMRNATLEILYSETNQTSDKTRYQKEEVRGLVDNAEVMQSYKQSVPRGDEYDYLIISNSTLIGYNGAYGFQEFRDGLASRGFTSKLVDINTVASVQGADLTQKVRNFIRSEYEQYGIKYVLLAADAGSSKGTAIPVRHLWSRLRGYTGSWQWIEKKVASDFYYSCLDGPFNGNGNDKWGEPTDGENGGDVDLLPEVIVGRVAMNTTDELKNFVRKTLWISSNVSRKNTYLMGEELFKEMDLYGADYMNQLVGACSDHNYVTDGYGSDWETDTLYDRNAKWSGSTALSRINANDFSMINHLGHSNTTYNMRMYMYFGFPKFTNANPFFYYTQGCYPGDFTASDCFIEKMVTHSNAAVASIANTAYGLGPEDPDPDSTVTPGASQILHRTFINAIFNEGFRNLGAAHQRSKVFHIGYSSAQELRWVYWVATYFGDPSLEMQY